MAKDAGSALKTAGSSDLVGSVIAERYHIQKKLGEGGMGAVYLGEHEGLHKPVAVKLLHAELADRDDLLKRSQREA
jgi:serine/threonine protein kinase